MAEKSTIARPYAQAAFDIAEAEGNLPGWSEMLAALASVASDEAMQAVISDPSVDDEVINGLFFDLCGEVLSDKGRNFVRVLTENGRLDVLPEIAAAFEAQRAEAEKTVNAEVTSAFPLSDAQQKAIIEALKKRLGRDVSLETKVDASIVGGAVVRAGDLVIDASVNSQLEKLAASMMR